jgi:hypothetical protein
VRIAIKPKAGPERVCDTADDKVAGAWMLAEIRRLIKGSTALIPQEFTVSVRYDTTPETARNDDQPYQ